MTETMSHSGWRIVLCDSLEKVFADEEPRAFDTAEPLVGYRGGRTSFQLAFRPPPNAHAVTLGEVRISVSVPSGVQALVHAVELVPVSLAAFEDADEHYLRRGPGLYPDLLRPTTTGEVSPVVGQWRAGWIDVVVSADAPPGAFELTATVRSTVSDEVLATFPVPLVIPDVVLPQLDIPHTEWLHCDAIADHYGHEPFSEEHWRIVEAFLGSAARAQVNTAFTPVWTPPLDTTVDGARTPTQLLGVRDDGDGCYVFDFAPLRRWLAMCRRRGIVYLEMPHLFTQWGALATPPIFVDTPGGREQRFGWQVVAGDPRYRRFLEQLLPALRAVLEQEWGLSRVFFHVSDEPTGEQLESYAAARAVVADLLEGCIVIDAVSDPVFHRAGLISPPVVASDHAQHYVDAGVSPLWIYYCVSQSRDVSNRFISLPSVRTRVLGAQLYTTSAAGFLHWGFNFYNSYLSRYRIDPFLDTCAGSAFLGGDAFLVYPGSDGEPIESIRHRLIGEAFTDYRSLRALHDAGRPEQARGLADQDGSLRMDRFSYDPGVYRAMAARIAAALEEAQRGADV